VFNALQEVPLTDNIRYMPEKLMLLFLHAGIFVK
jgi:hypothetical protein